MSILPLIVENASVRRRGKVLVGPLDLQLADGDISIVMGPNGAGKTSLLKLLHGLLHPSTGTVTWACPLAEARARQAFVFQAPVLLRRNVRDNIALPLMLRGVPRTRARARADDWAERVGLGGFSARRAQDLSGGERQKLALARALICEPEMLFLDEPTANLDGRATREIETILAAAVTAGTRILMATHNIGQARRLANDVIFLYRGRIHEQNRASRFFAAPQTREAAAFLKGDIVE